MDNLLIRHMSYFVRCSLQVSHLRRQRPVHYLQHFHLTVLRRVASIMFFQSPAPHSAVCTNSSLSPSQLPARSPVRRQRPTKRAPFLACRRLVTNSISHFPESIVTCHTNPAQHKGHPGLPHDQLADDSSQESTAPLLRVWLGMVLRLLRVGQRVSFYCTLMVRSKHVASSE